MNTDRVIQVGDVETTVHFIAGLSKKEKSTSLRAKLIPTSDVEELGNFLRKRDLTKAFTTGVFDMVHIGHARYLQLAASLGDVLIVGLNSDDSVHKLKGPDRPILDQQTRAEMLSFFSFVDYITIFDEPTGAEVIRRLKPGSYLCVEGSWNGDDIATKDEVVAMAKNGGETFYTPRQSPTLSTTAIIERIATSVGRERDEELRQLREMMTNGKR